MSDFEGDDKEGSERADAQALDERLPAEDLTPMSVEDEIGGRSLAEIAEAACRLTGIEPEPELFEADGAAAAAEATQAEAAPERRRRTRRAEAVEASEAAERCRRWMGARLMGRPPMPARTGRRNRNTIRRRGSRLALAG